PRRPGIRKRRPVHDRAARSHGRLRDRDYNTWRASERSDVRYLRTASTRTLVLVIAGVLGIAAAAAAIAVAAGGGGPTPPPQPLDQAIHDALAAPAPAGVTARVEFTNNLFPSGALLGQTGSALMSGASGRLWITNDRHGRIELQSDAGDVQIVWSPT